MATKFKPMPQTGIDYLRQWAGWLDSGEYTQGTHALRRLVVQGEVQVHEYCCLGVALDKAPGEWNRAGKFNGGLYHKPKTCESTAWYSPPELEGYCSDGGLFFPDEEGIYNRIVSITQHGRYVTIGTHSICVSLPDFNDGGTTFKQIAQLLRLAADEWEAYAKAELSS